jgi:hypothetical protein
MVREYKECCVPAEVDGREDREEVENVGSEQKSVSSKYEKRWEL